MRKADTERLAL